MPLCKDDGPDSAGVRIRPTRGVFGVTPLDVKMVKLVIEVEML